MDVKTVNELYESLSEQERATIDAFSKMLYALFLNIGIANHKEESK